MHVPAHQATDSNLLGFQKEIELFLTLHLVPGSTGSIGTKHIHANMGGAIVSNDMCAVKAL